jgi:hypothetical protein
LICRAASCWPRLGAKLVDHGASLLDSELRCGELPWDTGELEPLLVEFVTSGRIAADAIVALQSYAFPGNVRELEHLIDRAAVKAGGRAITSELIRGSRDLHDQAEAGK